MRRWARFALGSAGLLALLWWAMRHEPADAATLARHDIDAGALFYSEVEAVGPAESFTRAALRGR